MFRLHLADSVLMHTGWASSHSSSDEPRCKNNDGSFCSVDSDGFCSFFFGEVHHNYNTVFFNNSLNVPMERSPPFYPNLGSLPGEYGDLYKVTLTHDEDLVSEVQVKYFDTVPLSNALCVPWWLVKPKGCHRVCWTLLILVTQNKKAAFG